MENRGGWASHLHLWEFYAFGLYSLHIVSQVPQLEEKKQTGKNGWIIFPGLAICSCKQFLFTLIHTSWWCPYSVPATASTLHVKNLFEDSPPVSPSYSTPSRLAVSPRAVCSFVSHRHVLPLLSEPLDYNHSGLRRSQTFSPLDLNPTFPPTHSYHPFFAQLYGK